MNAWKNCKRWLYSSFFAPLEALSDLSKMRRVTFHSFGYNFLTKYPILYKNKPFLSCPPKFGMI